MRRTTVDQPKQDGLSRQNGNEEIGGDSVDRPAGKRAPPKNFQYVTSLMLGSGATLVLPREATRDLELMESLVAWVPPQAPPGLPEGGPGRPKKCCGQSAPARLVVF